MSENSGNEISKPENGDKQDFQTLSRIDSVEGLGAQIGPYKLVAFEMMDEAGVYACMNTLLVGAIMDGSSIKGVIAESRAGREVFYAKSFIDCTGFGDLAAFAGAEYTEPNDYAVSGGFGIGNVSVEGYHSFLSKPKAMSQMAIGRRSGEDEKIVRLHCCEWGTKKAIPREFVERANKIGLHLVVTTIHDNYFMFVKVNVRVRKSLLNRDAVAEAELKIRERQLKAVELFREYVPGCEKAFISRTSPHINARRVRCIKCDYDIKGSDVTEGVHFDDDTFAYGFHDSQPRVHVKNGGTYGIPYRAYLPVGIDNLLATGMMITSSRKAFHSTRNTVSCMGKGQAAGTAAALCAQKNKGTRDLRYADLRQALVKGGVYFES